MTIKTVCLLVGLILGWSIGYRQGRSSVPASITVSSSTGAVICYTEDGDSPAATTNGVCTPGVTYKEKK